MRLAGIQGLSFPAPKKSNESQLQTPCRPGEEGLQPPGGSSAHSSPQAGEERGQPRILEELAGLGTELGAT